MHHSRTYECMRIHYRVDQIVSLITLSTANAANRHYFWHYALYEIGKLRYVVTPNTVCPTILSCKIFILTLPILPIFLYIFTTIHT